MIKKKARQEPIKNSYDEYYKNKRWEYMTAITGLSVDFTEMRGAWRMRQMTGSSHWEEKEREKYIKFKFSYNIVCSYYDELVEYHKLHYDEFNECKTWNETLRHPDDWLIEWAGKE